MPTNRPLTPRQEKFIVAYLKHGNGTRAVLEAGYSKNGAAQQSVYLLRNPKVRVRLAAPIAKVAAKAELTAQRVLEEMRRLAMADLRAFFDEHGNVKPVTDWTEEMGSQAGSMETIIKNAKAGDGITDEVLKFKLHDKTRALEMLGKHFKLLTDVVQVIDGDKMIARLHRGRDRVAKLKKG